MTVKSAPPTETDDDGCQLRTQYHEKSASSYRDYQSNFPEQSPESRGRSSFRYSDNGREPDFHDIECMCNVCLPKHEHEWLMAEGKESEFHCSNCMWNVCLPEHERAWQYQQSHHSADSVHRSEDDPASTQPCLEQTFTYLEIPGSCSETRRGVPQYRPDHEETDSEEWQNNHDSAFGNEEDDTPGHSEFPDDTRYEHVQTVLLSWTLPRRMRWLVRGRTPTALLSSSRSRL